MRAVATKTIDESVTQETAIVLADDPLLLRAGSIEYRAERAASCLLRPRAGDEVLVALLPDRRAFVLAVLVRPGQEGAAIEVRGDLKLRAEGGRVEVSGAEGVSVVTPREVSMLAARVSVRAVATSLASEAVTLVSRTVAGEMDRVKMVARTFDAVLDRVTQRAKNVMRVVEESDHVRAAQIDYAAHKSVTLHGENALVTAKELIKVDGSQIHLG